MRLHMRFQSRLASLLTCVALGMVLGSAEAAFAQGDAAEAAQPAAETSCAAGDGLACLRLGETLYSGQNGAADVSRALDLFAAACDLGAAQGCFRLGAELEFPDFGAPDTDGALDAYTRACALGLEAGCGRAGIELSADSGAEARAVAAAAQAPLPPPAATPEDTSRDAPVIVTASAPPTEESFIEESLLTDFASEALPDLDFGQAAAGAGAPAEAMDEETELSQEMAGIPTEPSEDDLLAEERQAMAEACGRGEMEACEMFAAWLRDGTGGAQDGVRARRIFSVICTEGSVKGCYELGWMMYDAGLGSGSGLDTDELELSRARFLFAETCKAGIFEACLQGADMRRKGEGGRVDPEGAGRLYAIACEDGLEAGCVMMAPALEDAPAEAEASGETPAAEAAAPEEDAPAE